MSSCTFKPKGMSYTEFLRSKKSTAVKVINTKKLQDASDITTQRRLGASQVFALNNDEVKGVINHPPDFSQEPLRELQSSYKTGGSARKPGDASDFTAYIGGQAIGKEIQAGLPDARITQTPAISLTSSAVPQSASDFTRRTQGCKESLGQPHQAATVTPPVFVDDTIRNLGNPTQCTTQSITRSGTCANSITTRPANHSIKAATAFPDTPNRPSQGGGQYALKGDREPGKEAGVFGGVTIAHVKSNIPVKSIRTRSGINVNYKVGAALDNIPYVENHHGNDLGVNPKQPFVKYQIPGGVTPAHLKINKPISTLCCPTGRPIDLTLLERIATLTSPDVYTLRATTVILPAQTLTIPPGITLKIPPGLLLTNNGIVLLYGTIDNDDFTNNATLTIPLSGTFITTVLFTNSSRGTVNNSGSVIITSAGTVTNSGVITITSTGGVTNSGTITNNASATVTNSGTIINNAGATLTNIVNGIFSNNSIVTNDGTLANAGTLTNGGTITNNSLITNSRNINNNNTLTNSATGTIANTFGFQMIVGSTFNNAGTVTNTNTLNFAGRVFNTGTMTSSYSILDSTAVFYNYNGGIFTQNTSRAQVAGYQLNNANGSGGCGTGTLNGTVPLTATGTTCPP